MIDWGKNQSSANMTLLNYWRIYVFTLTLACIFAREYKGSVLRRDDTKNKVKTTKSYPPSKGSNGKKGKDMRTTGILVGGLNSTDLQVLGCDSTSVVIQGVGSSDVVIGVIFIFVGDGDITLCSQCSPLFRKVTSIAVSSSGIKTLTTTFATMGEIFDKTFLNPASKNVLIEPLAGCAHSGINVFSRTSKVETSATTEVNGVVRSDEAQECPLPTASTAGSCVENWLSKNSDGRCTFTNCFVGTTGDPANCFECADLCDNGCGKAGSTFFQTDGDFFLFDFGPACCNHDFCWSSNTFTKSQCDFTFYRQMMSQCVFNTGATILGLPLTIAKPFSSQCQIIATAFYLAVSLADDAYDSSQRCQQIYEETDSRCIAQCPTTQTSGGQGLQVLSIDLLTNSGTFPVMYEMYQIPDELFIVYEGIRIFETGGLVSSSCNVDVAFSGQSTIIQVTINAPNSGTIWDVFVGCPE